MGKKKKFLIVGSGGRESAFAMRLAEENIQLYAVINHKNPLIIDCVKQSDGRYVVGDANDPHVVLDFVKSS